MPPDASNPERAATWFAAHVVGIAVGLIAAMAGAMITSLWDFQAEGAAFGFLLGQFISELCLREMNKEQ